jgi:HD-like signal output (HDOD) protein
MNSAGPPLPHAPTVDSPRVTLANRVAQAVAVGKLTVPLLPQVAMQVVELAGSDRADAAHLSALIHRDPALAGQVLRIANSPAYQPRMPIVSLQQAIARLGLGVLSEIALAASLQSGVFRVPAAFAPMLREQLEVALGTAAYAKEVARLRRLSVETAFLCGLMHDIGRPVVLQAALDEAARLRLPLGGAAGEALAGELAALCAEHAVAAGLLVAEAWKLPAPVRASVAHHDAPAAAGAHARDAAVTHAARRLALAALVPAAQSAEDVHEHAAFAELNLYRDEVAALLARGEAIRDAVKSLGT